MHMARLDETVSAHPSRANAAESWAVDLLALSRIRGLGDEGVARVLGQLTRDRKNLSIFFESSRQQLRERFRLRASTAEWVEKHAGRAREEAAACYSRARELKITILAPDHPGYPEGLGEFFDGNPPLLYAHGNLELLAGQWRS